jgi:hypothetical protein
METWDETYPQLRKKRDFRMRLRNIATIATVLVSLNISLCQGGDWLSGTYLDPALQRPDFFSHHIWKSIPEHRQVYNRPRYIPGYIAYKIEPSSQEAMAWRTNYCNGNYANHSPGQVPYYYYPKPWEALNTRARPDTTKPASE